MYIWKAKSLSADIRNNSINQREWKKYYLAISIFMSLAMYLMAIAPRENLIVVLVEAVVVVVTLIVGFNVTYQTNGGDNGIDYVPRMTALSLPITIKLFLVSLLFGIVVGVIGEIMEIPNLVIEWIMVVFVIIVQVGFFWRINAHLKYINS